MSEQTLHIGERVADWRKRRGKSQRVLAGLAGISQGYLSLIETGARPVERRATLVALAGALQVSVAELSGQSGDPTDPAKAEASANVPAIREALIMRELGEMRPAPHAVPVADLLAAGTDYDFATTAAMLPPLLGAAAGPDLVQTCLVATFTLKHLGYDDLSRDAARLSLLTACDLEDPVWIGVAEVNRLIGFPLELPTAPTLARRAADEIQPQAGQAAVRQAYGMLHLHAAIRAAVAADQGSAMDHLDEARDAADSLGEPADLGLAGLAFGPTNVGIWRTAVLAELGDMEQAVAVGEQVEPRRVRARNRQAAFWVDRGRALAAVRRDNEAISAFLSAESVCPQWVRLRRNARDTIGVILRRTRRNAVSKPMRRAAAMVGLHD
jgi:transcriptional regulator with XRE-family HTH domain